MTKLLKKPELSDDQKRCYDLLCESFGGSWHLPENLYSCGQGIKINYRGHLATFDNNTLTRLVVLAHDRCVRVEIAPAGPSCVAIKLHARRCREGDSMVRHPTMEKAVELLSRVELIREFGTPRRFDDLAGV